MSAFWLSNCHELCCVLKYVQESEGKFRQRAGPAAKSDNYSGSVTSRGIISPSTNPTEKERALMKVRTDVEDLVVRLYYGWIVELKKRVQNMIIPSIIENQSLPGYVCRQTGGLWNRLQGLQGQLAGSAPAPTYTIDQLLNFMSKLNKTMKCYYLDDGIGRQIITEIVKMAGVHSFNHLVMRRNFCTWKRGVQIQYNITRLEEWCKTHQIQEGMLCRFGKWSNLLTDMP